MKPLPEAVQRAFPAPYGHLPERPWWCRVYGDVEPRYRRAARVADYYLTVEEAAAYDAAHPLPHPGYRAGQVWSAEDGESVVVMRVLLRPNDVWLYLVGGGWKSEEFARVYPYLMADPACPHLAPWSPAEVKP